MEAKQQSNMKICNNKYEKPSQETLIQQRLVFYIKIREFESNWQLDHNLIDDILRGLSVLQCLAKVNFDFISQTILHWMDFIVIIKEHFESSSAILKKLFYDEIGTITQYFAKFVSIIEAPVNFRLEAFKIWTFFLKNQSNEIIGLTVLNNIISMQEIIGTIFTTGHYVTQMTGLEVFLTYLASCKNRKKSILEQILPKDLSALYEKLCSFELVQFDVECRKLLNYFNMNFCKNIAVYSIIAESGRIGPMRIENPNDAQLWIDFNSETNSVSFFCSSSTFSEKEHFWIIVECMVTNISLNRSKNSLTIKTNHCIKTDPVHYADHFKNIDELSFDISVDVGEKLSEVGILKLMNCVENSSLGSANSIKNLNNKKLGRNSIGSSIKSTFDKSRDMPAQESAKFLDNVQTKHKSLTQIPKLVPKNDSEIKIGASLPSKRTADKIKCPKSIVNVNEEPKWKIPKISEKNCVLNNSNKPPRKRQLFTEVIKSNISTSSKDTQLMLRKYLDAQRKGLPRASFYFSTLSKKLDFDEQLNLKNGLIEPTTVIINDIERENINENHNIKMQPGLTIDQAMMIRNNVKKINLMVKQGRRNFFKHDREKCLGNMFEEKKPGKILKRETKCKRSKNICVTKNNCVKCNFDKEKNNCSQKRKRFAELPLQASQPSAKKAKIINEEMGLLDKFEVEKEDLGVYLDFQSFSDNEKTKIVNKKPPSLCETTKFELNNNNNNQNKQLLTNKSGIKIKGASKSPEVQKIVNLNNKSNSNVVSTKNNLKLNSIEKSSIYEKCEQSLNSKLKSIEKSSIYEKCEQSLNSKLKSIEKSSIYEKCEQSLNINLPDIIEEQNEFSNCQDNVSELSAIEETSDGSKWILNYFFNCLSTIKQEFVEIDTRNSCKQKYSCDTNSPSQKAVQLKADDVPYLKRPYTQVSEKSKYEPNFYALHTFNIQTCQNNFNNSANQMVNVFPCGGVINKFANTMDNTIGECTKMVKENTLLSDLQTIIGVVENYRTKYMSSRNSVEASFDKICNFMERVQKEKQTMIETMTLSVESSSDVIKQLNFYIKKSDKFKSNSKNIFNQTSEYIKKMCKTATKELWRDNIEQMANEMQQTITKRLEIGLDDI